MKKLSAIFMALLTVVSMCVPVLAVDAVSASVDTSGSTAFYNTGDTVNVVLSLSDISFGEGNGVSTFEFYLQYDKNKVTPAVSASADTEGDRGDYTSLITASPDGWEGFGVLDTDEAGYDLGFSDYSGEGTVTQDGELVITIPFKVNAGVKNSDIVFRFSRVIAYSKNMEESYELSVPDVAVRYSVVPSETVLLPSDAITLDIAGYKHAINNVIYYANEDISVSDYVSAFVPPVNNQDQLSDFGIIIVNSLGVVTYCDIEIGSDKSEVVIPKGSCIIAVHKDSEGFAAFAENADEGKEITLYNVNLQSTGNVTVGTDISGAGFVIGDYAEGYVPEADELKLKDGVDAHFDENGSVLIIIGNNIDISEFKGMFENSDFDVLDESGEVIPEDGIVGTGDIIDVGTGITIVLLGDVDCNGLIEAMDYLLLKRAYFGTFKPTEAGKIAARLTNMEKIEATDYIYLKRVYFGTAKMSTIYNQYWK